VDIGVVTTPRDLVSDDSVVTAILNACGKQSIPSKNEQLVLGRLIQAGLQPDATPGQLRAARRARERLVAGNARLAVKVAKGYTKRLPPGSVLGMEDLIQESLIGLDLAAKKFDPARGYAFSTMATWWCKQAVGRAIQVQSRTIRLTTTALDIQRRWRYKPAEQTLEEFCVEWGYKAETVTTTLSSIAMTECGSLDKVANNGDGSSLIDMLADEEQPDLDSLHYTMTMEQLEAAPETSDAIAALQLAQTAKQKEMAEILEVSVKQVPKRLEDLRAVVREHLINPCPCQTGSTEIELMPATANGHAHLESLIEEVQAEPEHQAEAQPAPKAKRVRRTRAEIEAANSVKAAKQPALVTVAIGGMDIAGTPASLAAVIRELQHGKVAA
jgi:RNA polymerase sigma factor (sigma-70 family)